MKNYIIKVKDSMAYLKKVNAKGYVYTFDIEEAKKYSMEETKELQKIDNFDIVDYSEELYKSKEEKYKLYIDVISKDDNISKDDLLSFLQEYEFAADGSGKFTSYVELREQYPNSKFIDEIVRLGEVIKNTNTVIWHEAIEELAKDKQFNDGIYNKVKITKENIEEYNKAKTFLKNMQQQVPYDYDIEQQYNMLDRMFWDKYINKEIYKEYLEVYHDEELEEDDEELST